MLQAVTYDKLECGPMPNVMAALPNTVIYTPPVIYTWSRCQSFSFSKSTSIHPPVIYFRSQSYSFMWLAPFVQHCKVLLMPATRVLCSNAAKTWKPLKFAGVPQTPEPISAASGPSSPYCKDIWGRYCCLTSFFPIVDTCLSCENIAQRSCAMVPRWRIFGDIFASCISSEPSAAHFGPAI